MQLMLVYSSTLHVPSFTNHLETFERLPIVVRPCEFFSYSEL